MTTLTNAEKLRLTGGLYVGRRARKHSYDLKLLRFECLKCILGLALANIIKVAQADKIDTNEEEELIKVYKFLFLFFNFKSFPLTAAAALSEASRCGIGTC